MVSTIFPKKVNFKAAEGQTQMLLGWKQSQFWFVFEISLHLTLRELIALESNLKFSHNQNVSAYKAEKEAGPS